MGPFSTAACTHLHLKFVADVASIQLRADELELPVKQGPGVPVSIAEEVQNLLVAGHGVHTCEGKGDKIAKWLKLGTRAGPCPGPKAKADTWVSWASWSHT